MEKSKMIPSVRGEHNLADMLQWRFEIERAIDSVKWQTGAEKAACMDRWLKQFVTQWGLEGRMGEVKQ